ncbi:MAG: hypothetical protein K0R54_1399 [Clostridiaceae bacterium]|jgi:hypothetical protein|nr:hypothetical protein [Clostridiaceae bacterium]
MKRIVKYIIISLFIVILTLVVKINFITNNNDLIVHDKNIHWNVVQKGLRDAADFTEDDKGNLYIAYNNRIDIISNNGISYTLIKVDNVNISSIEYYKNKLYYCGNTRLYCYDLNKKNNSEILGSIPNYGDYNKSIIKIYNDYLFLSIGSVTNSGVVGEDNKWLSNYSFYYDLSPKEIVLKGINFNNNKTGAFVPYNSKSVQGQVIPSHFPGNSSLVSYNLKNGEAETYAWGIRDFQGLDIDSSGKIYSIVTGMENRGLRPVIGDNDYIYEIKKDVWYGFPDFSGGDPITSPKFKDKNGKSLSFILAIHPSNNPPAPIYQNDGISSLKELCIDKFNVLGDKDAKYFYDKNENKIISLNKLGTTIGKINLKSSQLVNMKFMKDKMIILCSNGVMYKLTKENHIFLYNNINILTFILIISILGILLVVIPIKKKK